MEKLSAKIRLGADCGSDHQLLLQNSDLNKVGKTTRSFRYVEKAMATHSSTLAWKIPGTEEPHRLKSMGSHRVRHD